MIDDELPINSTYARALSCCVSDIPIAKLHYVERRCRRCQRSNGIVVKTLVYHADGPGSNPGQTKNSNGPEVTLRVVTQI